MDNKKLAKILELHKKCVNCEEGGKRADLRGANLRGANLQGANLLGANIDYSSWPIWCGSICVKVDKRIAVQLLYHTIKAMKSVDDEECKAIFTDEKVLKLANQFHRVNECGKL